MLALCVCKKREFGSLSEAASPLNCVKFEPTCAKILTEINRILEESNENNFVELVLKLAFLTPCDQIRHFWVAKSLFLIITFNQKKQDKTF